MPETADHDGRDTHKLVQRFPYMILYQLLPGVLYVIAVMHTKQEPATWKSRADRNEPG